MTTISFRATCNGATRRGTDLRPCDSPTFDNPGLFEAHLVNDHGARKLRAASRASMWPKWTKPTRKAFTPRTGLEVGADVELPDGTVGQVWSLAKSRDWGRGMVFVASPAGDYWVTDGHSFDVVTLPNRQAVKAV